MENTQQLTSEQLRKLRTIAPHIKPSEVMMAQHGVKDLIELCGDDPSRDGLLETPFRVVKAFLEYTQGYHQDPAAVLNKTFDVDHDDLVLVKDIPYNSMCEHHFAPFFGKAHVAYIPNGKVVGLSKFARLTDVFAQRFQVQERMTNQIAQTVQEVLDPKGVAVIVEGTHYCMCGRGIKKQGSTTITSSIHGLFRENDALRKEVFDLIRT